MGSSGQEESFSTILKEITMTPSQRSSTTGTAPPYNIYRRSNLPRKRLFATKHSDNNPCSCSRFFKTKTILVIAFGVVLMSVSFSVLLFNSWSLGSELVDSTGSTDTSNNAKVTFTKNGKGGGSPVASKEDLRKHGHVPKAITGTGASNSSNSNKYNGSGGQSKSNEIQVQETSPKAEPKSVKQSSAQSNENDHTNSNSSTKQLQSCTFRTYKSNRYYKADDPSQEKFLSDADYIRGKLPFVLNPHSKIASSTSSASLMPKKLCLDTSDWEDVQEGFWPFSDGQNPSIVSLAPNVYDLKVDSSERKDRMDSKYFAPLKEIYNEESDFDMHELYLGLLLFGDSQCRWNLTTSELSSKKFSPLMEAPTKRSMVVVLNEDMQVIDSTVLKLELDDKWGTKKKIHKKQSKDGSLGFDQTIVELDDARLFFHNGQLHVLYRNGPYYGYEKQVQNPIHFKSIGGKKFEASIKASETFTICCGRNIAFISERPDGNNDELLALTWIDPVSTEVVTTVSSQSRRLSGNEIDLDNVNFLSKEGSEGMNLIPNDNNIHRILKGVKKSHIHGTNGYMLPLHSTSELLGIAHFHRPEGRETSHYARHGHHYTHAFFTVQFSNSANKYILKRLSNEFIYMAPSSDDEQTGDVIQFTSGLDLIGSDKDGRLLVSYGINDCEAATFFLGMKDVQELLIDVEEGHEVINLMENLSSSN